MNLYELETPCLILDKGKIRKNISALHQHLKNLDVNLRPHVKTVKNIDVAQMALAGQSGGITVSTLQEAEYFLDHGITDIVYAIGIAPIKMDHVIRLIKKKAKLTLLLDSVEQVAYVAQEAQANHLEIPVLIEIDCDGHRSGITPDDPLLLEIGHLLQKEKGVRLDGVLTHAGESYVCKSVDEIRTMAHVERDAVLKCAERLRQNNLPCPVISVGSTPTARFADDLTGITEVRAGVFMFYDLVMAGLGVCGVEDIAISVLASVIGHQKKKGWVITDAGWAALSRDRGTAKQKVDQGYGLVCNIAGEPLSDVVVSETNQEHGIISHRTGINWDSQSLKVGDMVRILPNHACATGVMHDRYYVVDGSLEITDIWHRSH